MAPPPDTPRRRPTARPWRLLPRASTAALVACLLITSCGGHPAQTVTPNQPGAAVVVLRHIAFNPAVLTVAVGTTVDWKWDDNGIAHNVVSVEPGPLHSPLQATGNYDYRFTTPGSYRYYCTVHPYMTGMIVVRP